MSLNAIFQLNMSQEIKLIDTHCHIDFPEFDADRDAVIRKANDSGIEYIINVGSSIERSRNSVSLAKKYNCVYACVGIHPHEADTFGNDVVGLIKEMASSAKIVAIGEIGLDYYKNYSAQDRQRVLFEALLGVSRDLNLPVVLHSRQAESDTLSIVKKFMPISAVVHCFSGDELFLRQCIELGFFVSFTCNITYKKADKLRQVVKAAACERIMLETDAPYLSPEGLRGKRNEPSNIVRLAQEVAVIKGITAEEVASITTDNAKRFFGI